MREKKRFLFPEDFDRQAGGGQHLLEGGVADPDLLREPLCRHGVVGQARISELDRQTRRRSNPVGSSV